ncbi:PAS domain S-box-containing protein [Desulfuromusa kysingii]|uniref:PAS domain S-box-containing protein n=1 Tax=Desulfuromusa kysingii TaxID=37625 RepID=A0A1H4E3M6_9BACT|nr:PAS and helix-turn-helix domain-containing protein [Desulfuromusa kysingii]SEA79180.1 PAS domain S-box-containing protein [Desulfuromusa kysingii]
MDDHLFEDLNASLDTFLIVWPKRMGEAGYLAHTTANRHDCVASFRGMLESIRCMLPDQGVPRFASMLKEAQANAPFLLQNARNHRLRGITGEMYLGCFKTLIHSLEDTVLTLKYSAEEKLNVILKIRLACDVLETLFIDDWERSSAHEMTEQLQEVNRLLTLKKNRYENIFRSTSDLVILTDHNGVISEINPAAKYFFATENLQIKHFWEFLSIDCCHMDQLLDDYPIDETHEVTSRVSGHVFNLRIVPLSRVSLATLGYMLILNDITLFVNYRQELEQKVHERTAELILSQDLLRHEKLQTDEMNVTLRNVMKSIESDRCKQEQSITSKIRSQMLPALEKVRLETSSGIRANLIDQIEQQLTALTSDTNLELDANRLKLSKTETRICDFIQAGYSSNEISEAMNLAFDTIRTHRKNIRKKLGLQGKDINLFSYLTSRNHPSPEDK